MRKLAGINNIQITWVTTAHLGRDDTQGSNNPGSLELFSLDDLHAL